MAASAWNVDDPTRRRLYAVGLGVVGSATVLGGLLWLIRRQIAAGDVVKVTLVHELDPATQALAARWLLPVQQMAEEGLTHRVRLFQRDRAEDLLGASIRPAPAILLALAPASAFRQTPMHLF